MAHGHATSRTARPRQHGSAEVAHQDPPDEERDGRTDQHGGHEHGTDPVGDALQRRLVPLGLVDQALEPGQHRLGGHGAHPHHEHPAAVAGPPGDLVTRVPVDRQRLAGQHRLVDGRFSRATTVPSSGQRLAGPHPHQGPDRHGLGGHQLAVVVVGVHHPGGRGPQGEQGVQGGGGPSADPGLDGPTGHQDGHDERGHHPVEPGGEGTAPAEVHVAPAEGDGLDGADTARAARVPRAMSVSMLVAPCRASRAAVAEERPPAAELDGDGQEQHDPAGGGPSRAPSGRRPGRRGPAATRSPARTIQWSGSAGPVGTGSWATGAAV